MVELAMAVEAGPLAGSGISIVWRLGTCEPMGRRDKGPAMTTLGLG
jgi:hypothetical protein